MYLQHFRLRELPFGLTPNAELLVNLASHHEAMNVITLALRTGEGFVKLTGEVGTGKTLLCRRLISELGDSFATAYLADPMLSPLALRKAVAEELGITFAKGLDAHELLVLIREALVAIHEDGQQAVLIVDEAQTLPDESLESIRLLTNLETSERKLLQVVLVGQPELDQRLKDPALRQLAQRIVFSQKLGPMLRHETDAYVHARLQGAGSSVDRIFTIRALAAIHRASGGIPRLVNVLAHKSLMVAYGRGDAGVRTRHVWRAIADSKEALRWARRRPGRVAAARWARGSRRGASAASFWT